MSDDTDLPLPEPDTATEPDAPPTPGRITDYTFSSITQRWVLSGPAGKELDILVGGIALSGVPIEAIVPGTVYRLNTGALWLLDLAAKLATAGYTLEQERPKPDTTDFTLAADERRAWRRAVYVQGPTAAFSHAARAIDAGLVVTSAGTQRWRVTGAGLILAKWVSNVSGLALDEVLRRWSTNPEAIVREDDHAPTVNVALPDRRIETEFIKRDKAGNIETVVQTERTTPTKGGKP